MEGDVCPSLDGDGGAQYLVEWSSPVFHKLLGSCSSPESLNALFVTALSSLRLVGAEEASGEEPGCLHFPAGNRKK